MTNQKEDLATVKQDTRHLQDKIKESFKDTDFRKYIRDTMLLKKVPCPKNKTKNIELKFVQVNFNDSLFLNVDEIINRFLKQVISAVKKDLDEKGFNSSFELSNNFLKRNDFKIDLGEFNKIKINDFIFYYSVVRCRKETYSYDFVDPDLSRGISEEELADVVNNHEFTTEDLDIFDVRFIFPVKRNKKELKNKRGLNE